MTAQMTRTTSAQMIVAAMRYLDSLNSDRARDQNGIGFDKADTGIGAEFAAVADGEIDDHMLVWGYKRCRKYRRQLEARWGDGWVDAISDEYAETGAIAIRERGHHHGEEWWERNRRVAKEVVERKAAEQPRVQYDEREPGRVYFTYPYNLALNEVVKALGARFDGIRRCWAVTVTAHNVDRILLLIHHDPAFAFDDAAMAHLTELKAKFATQPQLPEKRVELFGGGYVRFVYPFSRETNDLVKGFGARFDGKTTSWSVPLTANTIPGVLALASVGFDIPQDVRAACNATLARASEEAVQRERNKAASKAATTATELVIPGFVREPYPFQKAGIEYAAREKRVLIADAPGLGKTLSAIGAVQLLNAYPCVVVCPTNVKYNWQREWDLTVPGKKILVIEGKTTYDREEYLGFDVVVINYDILGSHSLMIDTVLQPKAFVADESHYLKNKKAARTKAAKGLAEGRDVRILLTGTPVLNAPVDLLSQLEILGRVKEAVNKPEVDNPGWYYLKHFCAGTQTRFGWDFGGAHDLETLNANMRGSFYIRRLKEEVLKELPPKTRTMLDVEIDNRGEYRRAEAEVVRFLAEAAISDRKFNASLGGLSKEEREEARRSHYHSVSERAKRAEVLVRFNALKQLALKGKLAQIKAWIADFLESGQKLVVMCWHREGTLALAKEFDAPVIMGGVTGRERQAAVDRFQNDPECRVIVCNIIAAGEGITLTAASNTLFCELGWNPGKMEQAEDRIHRISQTAQNVTIWYMLGKDTIEEKIWGIIRAKGVVVRGVADGVWDEESAEDEGSVLGELVQMMLPGKAK